MQLAILVMQGRITVLCPYQQTNSSAPKIYSEQKVIIQLRKPLVYPQTCRHSNVMIVQIRKCYKDSKNAISQEMKNKVR